VVWVVEAVKRGVVEASAANGEGFCVKRGAPATRRVEVSAASWRGWWRIRQLAGLLEDPPVGGIGG